MNKIALELVCDGNSQIGFGHIRRSISLAKFFQSCFSQVSVRVLNPAAQHFLPQELTGNFVPDVVVVDCPYDVSDFILSAKNAGQLVVALDGNHLEPVNLNILVFNHLNLPINAKNRVGFEYIIIRPDLQLMKALVQNKGSILVSIGGGDYLGQSAMIANFLAENGFDVDLVLGPLATKDTGTLHPKVQAHYSPENFVQLMVDCRAAVTNGGGTLFELLYLDKPVWSIPQTSAEERVVDSLQKKGCLVGVGAEALLMTSDISNVFRPSLHPQVIDGLGMSRIANLVQELFDAQR